MAGVMVLFDTFIDIVTPGETVYTPGTVSPEGHLPARLSLFM